jgi:hypothetical protein
MHLSPDEARSDVILAAAATLFGGFVLTLVTRLPLYPRSGILGLLVGVFWIFALTGLVPLLLARYRGDGVRAFGLDGPRDGWRAGLVLLLPVAVLGILRELISTGALAPALLGRLGGATAGSPVVLGTPRLGLVELAFSALQLVALTAGALLLVTFLTVRGREGFRPVDLALTQTLRTFGMGAVGLALLLGLVRSIGPDARVVPVLMQVAALGVLVLLADRMVPLGPTFPRGAVLAPGVVVLLSHVFATGGLFRGDLLAGLYTGALGAGTAIVVAVLIATRRRAWAVVPLMVALHWWPSCLSPLAFEIGTAGC